MILCFKNGQLYHFFRCSKILGEEGKQEILQLRTVFDMQFSTCSKQTMNVFLHSSLAWICVDFSCKTDFISYHLMNAKTRVLKCCCLLFDWTEFWESLALLNRESWLAYGDFKEKTWLDHSTKTPFFYLEDSILLFYSKSL